MPRAVAIFEAELDDRTITEHTEINVVLTVGLSIHHVTEEPKYEIPSVWYASEAGTGTVRCMGS